MTSTFNRFARTSIARAAFLLFVFAPMSLSSPAQTSEWAWVSGSTISAYTGQAGIYGILGNPAPSNAPGSRRGAVSWTDNGNFWLFGGEADDAAGFRGNMNDLWMYSPTTGQWAWMSGGN